MGSPPLSVQRFLCLQLGTGNLQPLFEGRVLALGRVTKDFFSAAQSGSLILERKRFLDARSRAGTLNRAFSGQAQREDVSPATLLSSSRERSERLDYALSRSIFAANRWPLTDEDYLHGNVHCAQNCPAVQQCFCRTGEWGKLFIRVRLRRLSN